MTTFADLSGKARRGTRAARPPDDIASFRRLDLSDWNSTLRVMGQRKSGGTGPEKGETAEAVSPPASLEKGSDPFIPMNPAAEPAERTGYGPFPLAGGRLGWGSNGRPGTGPRGPRLMPG